MEIVRTEYVLAPMTDEQVWVEFAANPPESVGGTVPDNWVPLQGDRQTVGWMESVAGDVALYADAMLAEYKKRFPEAPSAGAHG